MLYINSLGRFRITDGTAMLDDETIRSDMLTKLLLYLLLHRNHNLTIEEIAYVLWQDDETENPAGALKNLMYRLRTILKKYFGDQQFILTIRGAYRWNPDILVEMDIEKMEAVYDSLKESDDPQEQIAKYELIMELYKGEFMGKIMDMHWVITLSTYYHSIFLNSVKGLAKLYVLRERYQDLEKIVIKGIQYDGVDEQLYCYQIQSLIEQNKTQLAMDAYEKAKKTLYEELGIRNPKELEQIHERLLTMHKSNDAEQIEQVQQGMEEEEIEGAFFCGYPVFREIYRLESRKISRMGEAEYIVLLTLETKETDEKTKNFRMKNAMERMESIIKKSLRIGDVAARYSDSQYIIMLPLCDYESSNQVAKRIVTQFMEQKQKRESNRESISVRLDFEQITSKTGIVN